MKKVIFSLIALVACITIQAAEISQQQAMAKARAFLSQQSGVRRAAADIQLQTAATGVRQLHAFNMEGGGYVIVSSSSRTRDILAYAPQGTLGDQMPPAMMELLKSYAAQITEVEQDGEDAEQDDAADDHLVKYEIVPLVSQRWGQEMPYNKLTPMVKDSDGNDVHGATGCVATAMAMVMKYHQWPKAQTPTLPATEYTTELPPVTFNWAAMTDTYSEQSSKESCDAVATLMLYCGAACQMEIIPQRIISTEPTAKRVQKLFVTKPRSITKQRRQIMPINIMIIRVRWRIITVKRLHSRLLKVNI